MILNLRPCMKEGGEAERHIIQPKAFLLLFFKDDFIPLHLLFVYSLGMFWQSLVRIKSHYRVLF